MNLYDERIQTQVAGGLNPEPGKRTQLFSSQASSLSRMALGRSALNMRCVPSPLFIKPSAQSNPLFFWSVLFVFRLVHCVYLLQRRDVLPHRWIPSMMVRPFHYLPSPTIHSSASCLFCSFICMMPYSGRNSSKTRRRRS